LVLNFGRKNQLAILLFGKEKFLIKCLISIKQLKMLEVG